MKKQYVKQLTSIQRYAQKRYHEIKRCDNQIINKNNADALPMHYHREMMLNLAYKTWKGDIRW